MKDNLSRNIILCSNTYLQSLLSWINIRGWYARSSNSELILVLAPLVPIQTSLSLKIMFVNIVYTILWIVWLILSYYWLFAYQLAGGVSHILFYDLWYVGFNQNSENQPKQNDTRNFALNDIFRSSHGYHGLMSKKISLDLFWIPRLFVSLFCEPSINFE